MYNPVPFAYNNKIIQPLVIFSIITCYDNMWFYRLYSIFVSRCLHIQQINQPWWRHQMEAFSALLAICAGNSPVSGEFPAQRPVTRGFDAFFDLARINGWVNNRQAGDLRRHRAPLWRHRNDSEKMAGIRVLRPFLNVLRPEQFCRRQIVVAWYYSTRQYHWDIDRDYIWSKFWFVNGMYGIIHLIKRKYRYDIS